jgi:phosphatidylglycerophosphate synthase
VRLGPIVGLLAQVALLAVLGATTGLGVAGAAAGVAYAVLVWAALTRGLYTVGGIVFGPADWVTLARATLVGGVTALTADSFSRTTPVNVFVGITVAALILDAVDGQVARRTGTVTGFGARFDMEVDAFLILVLCVYVAQSLGLWVLAIGAMRYIFVAASWVLRWMRKTLPPRFWRKVVAATEGIVLAVAAADVLPPVVAVAAGLASLGLLVESFGRDVVWLWRRRLPLPAPVNVAGPPERAEAFEQAG